MEHVVIVAHMNNMMKAKGGAFCQPVSDNKFYKPMVGVLTVLYTAILHYLIDYLVYLITARIPTSLAQMEDVRDAQRIQDH